MDEKPPGITACETVRAKKGEEADVKTDRESVTETKEEKQPKRDTLRGVVENSGTPGSRGEARKKNGR